MAESKGANECEGLAMDPKTVTVFKYKYSED